MRNRSTVGGITWETIAISYFRVMASPQHRLFFDTVLPTLSQHRFRYWMWRTCSCSLRGEPLPPLREPK